MFKSKRILLKTYKKGKIQKYIMKCLFCHKSFEISKYTFDRKEGKFCSYKCYWKYMKGKPTISSTKFKKGMIPWSKTQKGIHLSPNTEFKSGKLHPKWKPEGYSYIDKSTNYKMIKCSNHLRANKRGYVFRANLVTEFCLNRKLNKNECIHHINLIRNDDNPKNLYLFPNRGSHCAYHTLLRNKLVSPLISNLPAIDKSSLPENLRC